MCGEQITSEKYSPFSTRHVVLQYVTKGEIFHFTKANCWKVEKVMVLSVKNLFPLTQDINLPIDYGCAEAVLGELHRSSFHPFVLARVVPKRSVT